MGNKTYEFYKRNKNDEIWWVRSFIDGEEAIGLPAISFDKKTIYYLFADYPYKLTKEQKELFDKENSYWAEFFKDRA